MTDDSELSELQMAKMDEVAAAHRVAFYARYLRQCGSLDAVLEDEQIRELYDVLKAAPPSQDKKDLIADIEKWSAKNVAKYLLGE